MLKKSVFLFCFFSNIAKMYSPIQLILFDLFKVLFSFLVCTNAVIDPQKIQELGNTLICGGLASLSQNTQNS